jgi:hypothetical protein
MEMIDRLDSRAAEMLYHDVPQREPHSRVTDGTAT